MKFEELKTISKRYIERTLKEWQPPKPLVVVPKICDKWIKNFNDIEAASYWHILDRFVKDSHDLSNDFFGLGDLRKYPQGWDRVLMSALIDGYTVDKGKLYEVIAGNVYLIKKIVDRNDYMFESKDGLENWAKRAYQLTEAEIKSIDERYWSFAVPVDEVTE